jgi:hypothetical protein
VPGRLRPRRFLAIEGLLKYPTVYVGERCLEPPRGATRGRDRCGRPGVATSLSRVCPKEHEAFSSSAHRFRHFDPAAAVEKAARSALADANQ